MQTNYAVSVTAKKETNYVLECASSRFCRLNIDGCNIISILDIKYRI